jgi:hypothetical protein
LRQFVFGYIDYDDFIGTDSRKSTKLTTKLLI